MSGNNTFGDNNQVFTGDGNQRMGYHYHEAAAAPVVEKPSGPGTPTVPSDDVRARSVFVVHGRDEEVRSAMFGLLRRLDLRPLEWEQLVRATGKASPFLGEVVAHAPSQAQAALVLLTPDDIAKLHPQLLGESESDDETRFTGQPRQNVLIELGMVLMAYPERTVIVEVGRLRQAADTAGRNVIRFDGSQESIRKIVARLKVAECQVDDSRADWLDTSYFEDLSAYRRLA
ncbi:TIR domain-containing protein [Streptomyces sp. 4F14]|uniref:TIR domain-containing protein n=1 Tax=Streptomyces sp. 4F14 TaxID=3394380 RepID=UPI003A866515